MPLTRSDKEQLLEQYENGLAKAPHAFLIGYQGITVPQVTELRNRVRASGGEYVVVKNTVALRAIDSKALAQLKDHFVGPTAVVFSAKDPVALAKALTDSVKDMPALQFKAGMVEGRAIGAEQIKDIASLPSREALIAKLLFLLQSPIVRFARVLAAVPQSFVTVLDQVRKKKEEEDGAGLSGRGAPRSPRNPEPSRISIEE
jgi:large subunit ribosomal protein L10